MNKAGRAGHSTFAPLMPDAPPALHLANAINLLSIFEARLNPQTMTIIRHHLGNSLGNKIVLKGLNRGGIRGDKLLKTEAGPKDSYAHNPKVAGSNPAPATTYENRTQQGDATNNRVPFSCLLHLVTSQHSSNF